MKILPKRFQLLKTFSLTVLSFAFIVRVILYFLSINYIDFSFIDLIKIFAIGFFFDIGNLSYVLAFYAAYLLMIPSKYHGKKIDRIIQKFSYGFFLFIYIFSFLAEIPFWQEYQRRFNFIAVDYLLYTYKVIENIHQFFPIPLLIGVIILFLVLCIKYASKTRAYHTTFKNNNTFKVKLLPTVIIFSILGAFHFFIKSDDAEFSSNNNVNELSKSGMYSFFSAYRSNELNFNEFYRTIKKEKAYDLVKSKLDKKYFYYKNFKKNITRFELNTGKEQKPNVIFIGLESMSASFLKRYGDTLNLTPSIDSLQKKSIAFTNMYATGTRTIRGLESIILSIPPTPGRSIIKRKNNENLFTIGEVFKQKGYSRTFFNGVDTHFDNMGYFFGFNGFDIVDRKSKYKIQKTIPTKRIPIKDNQVTFENVWGACDGDMYNVILEKADKEDKEKPFFYFLMTNSNHNPYTFPEGIIDSNEKTRYNAVKYADKAFGNFFEKAKSKPWFKNTVFVVLADHCAYSAGRTELNLKNHHIPGFIYNLKNETPKEINKLTSQIDIFPTLFGYFNWNYESNFFGLDINKMKKNEERAFIGNHRKVALLKNDSLLVLETQKNHSFYKFNKQKNSLKKIKTDDDFLNETTSFYQVAFDLFKNNKLKVKNTSKK